MCRICGCSTDHDHDHDHGHGHSHDHEHDHGHAHPHVVSFETELLAKNDRLAAQLRERLEAKQIAAFNLIGAPGAGKTALLEHSISPHRHSAVLPAGSESRPSSSLFDPALVSVIEGDQATDNDARRIAATGCRVVQINTGAGCHLDATMMHEGYERLKPPQRSIVFVENVGNLVCPALFDLGERAKIVVMSVTEGEDKPLKYPHVFRAASALVLTKVDLVPYLDIEINRCIANARRVNPKLAVFPVAATRGDGLADWCVWIREQSGALRA